VKDRRSFIKKCATAALVFSAPILPGYGCSTKIYSKNRFKAGALNRALVAWYSQTGNTERHGRLITKTLEAEGLGVTSAELKHVDIDTINDHQLIIIGSPVFYYDTPDYVKRWMATLPAITGMPVASYVTFGGPEGNQHNAACSIIEGLVDKGGVPLALDAFMNMGTFPPVWSGDRVKAHAWATRHLPDGSTYQRVRDFTKDIIRRADQGQRAKFIKTMNMREFTTSFNPIWWTKRLVDQHYIIKDDCIECGNCVEKCPVDAIDLANFAVDRDLCELCFGCLNNCPAQAIFMEFNGQKLIGYLDFMKTHNLKITPPRELAI
jgi:ferredoxin